MIHSAAIEHAVQLATTKGNDVVEVSAGWTTMKQVVHMRKPIAMSVRASLMADSRLRYWTIDPTPHNASEEGFTDDLAKVAITFPRTHD